MTRKAKFSTSSISSRALGWPTIPLSACSILVSLLALAGLAHAAFPGANGRLAFTSDPTGSDLEVYSMSVDGSAQTDLSNNPASDTEPAWSPDGQKVIFSTDRDLNDEIYVMAADGSNPVNLTNDSASDTSPAWSPDGQKIAFTRDDGSFNLEIWAMNADGSAQTNLTNNPALDTGAAWSPDGQKIAFTTTRDGNSEVYVMNADGTSPTNLTNNAATDSGPDWSPDGQKFAFASRRDGNAEIYVMSADGSNPMRLTTNASSDFSPVWSPDGQKLAFRSNRDGNYEIYVMNADRTGQTRLTTNTWLDTDPDWQPLGAGYPRPKGATPLRASLAVAYKHCTSPNHSHGGPPPLNVGSCTPPVPESSFLTVGTLDANGQAANAVGSMRFDVKASPPEDVKIAANITDVRNKGDLSDYTGELQATSTLRVTDRYNAANPATQPFSDPATASDVSFPVTVPCATTTSDTLGSSCAVATTANSVLAGAINDTLRTIWQLGQIQVLDGGSDGVASTADNTLFMDEGIFVP